MFLIFLNLLGLSKRNEETAKDLEYMGIDPEVREQLINTITRHYTRQSKNFKRYLQITQLAKQR